jgi:putative transposase
MVFEFKNRCISKEEVKRIVLWVTKKIRKIFLSIGKVNYAQKKELVSVCVDYLLAVIYLYFDNDQGKLHKLFFPVVMANFIENGSIHSVIEEYRSQKNLYSWSYTYRLLNTLDNETSFVISNHLRKIMLKIVAKVGFKSKGFCVAIDITAKPFYGNKNLVMVKGYKKIASTNYSIQYLTAVIVEEGVRFNLLCYPISSLDNIYRKLDTLVKEISKLVPTKILFLDRWFGNKGYCDILKQVSKKFLMPITKNHKLKEIELCMREQCERDADNFHLVVMDYVFNDKRAKEYQLKVKLICLHLDGETFFFITNVQRLSLQEYYEFTKVYRYRFGIETGYRVDNLFVSLTTSVKSQIRYLHMQLSLVVEDLWTLVNFVLHSSEKKQPRESLKKKYSIIDLVRARCSILPFIWRPIVTAVQFKRIVSRVIQ